MRFFISSAISNPPLADRLDLELFTPALAPGEQVDQFASIAIEEQFPLGSYRLFAETDGNHDVIERSETNNFSAGLPIEVVDICTISDVDGNGYVNILDLIQILNAEVSLVTSSNQHLDIRRSPFPFPAVINRRDILSAIPCFGTLDALGDVGTLSDFALVPNGSGYQLDIQMSGQVVSIEMLLKLPEGQSLSLTAVNDLLQTSDTTILRPSSQEWFLSNAFHTTNNASRFLNGTVNAAQIDGAAAYDLSQLVPLAPGEAFDAGVAVHIIFADNSSAVLVKKLDYLTLPGVNFRSAVESELGLEPNQPIPGSLARTVTRLSLADLNISDASGLEAFTGLSDIYLERNNLTQLPDLSGITGLAILEVSNNQLTQMPRLPRTRLLHLGMSNNLIRELPDLTQMTRLWSLVANDNQITTVPDLSDLTNLEFLELSRNLISSISAMPPNVGALYLSGNRLSNAPQLGNLNLYYLSLNDNYITDISGLMNITFWSNPIVNIYNNNLSQEDCLNLRELSGRAALQWLPQPLYPSKFIVFCSNSIPR